MILEVRSDFSRAVMRRKGGKTRRLCRGPMSSRHVDQCSSRALMPRGLRGWDGIFAQHVQHLVGEDGDEFLLFFWANAGALGGLLEEIEAAGELLGGNVQIFVDGRDGGAGVVGGAAGGGGEVVKILVF